MATAAQLMGLGMPAAAAYLLDSSTPQATTAQLIASGLPPALAAALGDAFVASPPTTLGLMALGVPSALAVLVAATSSGPNAAPAITLPKWEAAKSRVAAGTGRGRIVCVGSSITDGYHGAATTSGGTNDQANAFSFSYPAIMAQYLAANGVPASFNSFIGDGNYGASFSNATYPTYNPTVSVGSFVYNATTASAYAAGGHLFNSPQASSSSPLVWTPPLAADTFEMSYVQNTGLNGFTYAFDGGAPSAVIATGGTPAGIVKLTANTSLGMHTLAIQEVGATGFGVFLEGVVAYNSAVKAVDVILAGFSGGVAADFNSAANPWNAHFALPALGGDLYLLEGPVNDSIVGTNLTTVQTSYQSLITALKAVGDVVLVLSPPYANGVTFNNTPLPSAATRASYDAILRSLAASNNLVLIDLPAHFVDWNTMSAANKVWDAVHPNKFGYADMGNYLGAQIIGL